MTKQCKELFQNNNLFLSNDNYISITGPYITSTECSQNCNQQCPALPNDFVLPANILVTFSSSVSGINSVNNWSSTIHSGGEPYYIGTLTGSGNMSSSTSVSFVVNTADWSISSTTWNFNYNGESHTISTHEKYPTLNGFSNSVATTKTLGILDGNINIGYNNGILSFGISNPATCETISDYCSAGHLYCDGPTTTVGNFYQTTDEPYYTILGPIDQYEVNSYINGECDGSLRRSLGYFGGELLIGSSVDYTINTTFSEIFCDGNLSSTTWANCQKLSSIDDITITTSGYNNNKTISFSLATCHDMYCPNLNNCYGFDNTTFEPIEVDIDCDDFQNVEGVTKNFREYTISTTTSMSAIAL